MNGTLPEGYKASKSPAELTCGFTAVAQTARFSVPLINPDSMRAISSSLARKS